LVKKIPVILDRANRSPGGPHMFNVEETKDLKKNRFEL
jgi:hypothetical protein